MLFESAKKCIDIESYITALLQTSGTLLFMFGHEKSQTSTNLGVIISLALEALSPVELQMNVDCNENEHNKRLFFGANVFIICVI